MSYEVKVIADSISEVGARITTFQLRYPRMIHQQVLQHRAISRNASSTRAIPMEKQIKSVQDDPAFPVYWGLKQKGMQSGEEIASQSVCDASFEWMTARDNAVDSAKYLDALNLHKQLAGRIIEPFAHISVVATATTLGWLNFFALRCNAAAMPEMQALAVPMARTYRDSKPLKLRMNYYHLPYITKEELNEMHSIKDPHIRHDIRMILIKASVARCARVSYLTHDKELPLIDDDIRLHNRLEASGHWSPFEHQATPFFSSQSRSGNFEGWDQYRQNLRVSVHKSFDFSILDSVYGSSDFVV